MSVTSNFGFTNVDVRSDVSIPTVDIEPVTTYAKVEDESTTVRMKNKTAPIDQQELLSFECTPITRVSTKLKISNPGRVTDGVQYAIRLDEVLRTVDATGAILQDDPVVMYLTVRHTNNAYVTSEMISTLFKRLCGAVTRADGTYRFDDLMLSALDPSSN